jgi:hypothetical protein
MREMELPTNPEETDTDIPEVPPKDPDVADPEEQAGSPTIGDQERLNDPERTETDIPDISPPEPDGADEAERPAGPDHPWG